MPGHLEKRGKNSWTIVLEMGRDPATGKRKRVKRSFKGSKPDATKEMVRLLHELETGLYIEASGLTFANYLNKWLADYAKNKVTPKTFTRYKEIVFKSVIPELGQIYIEKLKPLHLQNYYTKMLENGRKNGEGGLSPTTVLQHHRILHKALEMAVKWQIVPRNVADAVEPPKKAKKEITPLNEEQVKALINSATETQYFPQVVLAVFTGMRRGEIYGLRWRDVNFESGTITISQAAQYTTESGLFYKEPKSCRSRRTIDVSKYVLEVLKKVKVDQNKARLAFGEHYHDSGDLVFTQPDGRPQHPDSISSWFPLFMEKNDLPKIRLHDLRHTHASLLLKNGESLKLICDRLGHSGIGITSDIYTHLMPGMQKSAAEKLEDKIFMGT
jgi:integrase